MRGKTAHIASGHAMRSATQSPHHSPGAVTAHETIVLDSYGCFRANTATRVCLVTGFSMHLKLSHVSDHDRDGLPPMLAQNNVRAWGAR